MRLTHYTDYAIRTLMYLALLPDPKKLTTINAVAEAYQIPKNHLMKIVHQLATLGYIESVRGKRGGIRLAKNSKDINIGELIRHTEPDFNLVACFEQDPKNPCTISPECRLKHMFAQANHAFLKVLDSYCLADTLSNPEHMMQMLNIPPVQEIKLKNPTKSKQAD